MNKKLLEMGYTQEQIEELTLAELYEIFEL